MNTEPPTPSERALFAAQLFVLATIGTAVAALVVAWALLGRDSFSSSAILRPSLVGDLAFCAQVSLGMAALSGVVYALLKRSGR